MTTTTTSVVEVRFVKMIAVVGQMRTGTTVLRQMLGSAPTYFDLGEIFHGDLSFEVSFWGYLTQRSNTDPLSVVPDHWYDIWDEYIKYLHKIYKCGDFIIDIKIENFGNVLRPWPSGTWFFFPTDNVRFVYIERKNIVAQLVSRLKAEATNDWGWRNRYVSETQLERHYARFRRRGEPILETKDREPDPDLSRDVSEIVEEARAALRNSPIHVDPDRFALELEKIIDLNAWGLRTLAPYEPTILYYENLFDGSGRFHPKTLQSLSEVAGIDVGDFAEQPMLLKQAPEDFLEGIANRTELIRKFRGTKYAWMFPFW